MTSPEPVENHPCADCGVLDNHPMVHLSTMWIKQLPGAEPQLVVAPSFHHDCMPAEYLPAIVGGAHSQHPLLTARVFQACREDGVRGNDLRDLILGLQMRDFGDTQMMAKATSYANDVLDQGFNNGSSGTFVVGGTTYTLPILCRFQQTLSTAGTQGTEFTASGGYSAGGVSLAGLFTAAASAASKASTGVVTVSNSPVGTWAGNELTDSTSGTKKRMNFGPATSLGKTVNAADTCSIPIGSLTGAET